MAARATSSTLARVVQLIAATGAFFALGSARADQIDTSPAQVWLAAEGARVRGDGPVDREAVLRHKTITALRGETVAVQIVIEKLASPVSVQVAARSTFQGPELELEAYVALFTTVSSHTRSGNDREPYAGLGWTASARPRDEDVIGELPTALLPVARAVEPLPEGLRVVGGAGRQVIWLDIYVPEGAAVGRHVVSVLPAGPLRAVELNVDILPAVVPFRPVSVVAYYGDYEVASRFGDDAIDVEKQLWQLLHAHHIDALTSSIISGERVRALSGAWSGDWFRPEAGYRGPGAGIGPEVIPLGMYGELKDPTPSSVQRVREMVTELDALKLEPPPYRFLYAVDEQCESTRGPSWRRAMADAKLDVPVGHTCGMDPREQPVDLVMMPAQGYLEAEAEASKAGGKPVWAYNGQLPFAGPPTLDAPLTSLTINGWIMAAYGVSRWFYWETTFWNDDNKGGHGPHDPFLETETFHNADGDAELYDGLLLFPGQQQGVLPPSSHHDRAEQPYRGTDLGLRRVLPSMRLKALRRGILDAGLIGLARQRAPEAVDDLLREVVPRALSDVSERDVSVFVLDAKRLQDARDALRELAADNEVPTEVLRSTLRDASASHRSWRRERADVRRQRQSLRWGMAVGLSILLLLTLGRDRWSNARSQG